MESAATDGYLDAYQGRAVRIRNYGFGGSYSATDASGNESGATATVTVPHNQ